MLACTEMITMCLQSAKQKHLQAQQQQQQQQPPPLHRAGQGLTIFHDIFRRADKNDDGKLSFEEFNTYFADGILTTEELQELFYSIDGRQNNNLDTDKLSDYFSQHLGEYLSVLSALESLNIAILKAMDKTKEEYQGSSVLGQFVTRFMLRETSSQLLSLQRSLQCAMEAVEEQSSPAPREVKAPELTAVQKNGRRCGRRVHNNLCMSPSDPCFGILTTGVSVEDGENWCSQINRLQQLLDKLECQSPKLEPLKEDTLASTYKSNILLVQRQMSVTVEGLDNFRKVLKSYIDATSAHSDNLHVSVQKLPRKSCYIIYEFWQDRISWMSYLQSNNSKDFQRCIIDMLEDAEVVSTMLLPEMFVIILHQVHPVGELLHLRVNSNS
ncbi:N-terminal EF-hand calcium-binding protein 1 isoform X1 [Thunnus albacares]|uniref:N-terminal EF-hand calcium-binding protein 1 isoform X1 n=1 Tax=Thunnus albacares TaxID=8236 RepID=UPI001CF610E3|nr:N-terminal EF-hand calcium-binding protein 1 isoform X1 [Thunnus albacares]